MHMDHSPGIRPIIEGKYSMTVNYFPNVDKPITTKYKLLDYWSSAPSEESGFNDRTTLTTGEARNNITVQMVADIPVQSETIPATIAPKIPPTSKRMERSADRVGPKVPFDLYRKRQQCL